MGKCKVDFASVPWQCPLPGACGSLRAMAFSYPQELRASSRRADVKRFLVYSASKDVDGILRFYRKHGVQSWLVQMVK